MPDKSFRQLVKPFANKLGITSSSVLWRQLALRQYYIKMQRDAEYRRWVDSESKRWVEQHWGHETVSDPYVINHLRSQIYEITEILRARMGDVSDASVLDAGASDGFFLYRIGARRGIGVNFLYECAAKISLDGYASCLGDIEELPFSDGAFDYVICCETLEHVPNPIHTLNELARVCRKKIFLTIPWLPHTRITARPNGWPYVESHIFEFSEADFAKIVTHTHSRIVFQSRVQVFPEPRNPLLQWWFTQWLYPSFFPKLQYYEIEPVR